MKIGIEVPSAVRDDQAMPKRKLTPRDTNETAAALVQKVTGSKPVRGEDLLGSEELKRKFREAKKRL